MARKKTQSAAAGGSAVQEASPVALTTDRWRFIHIPRTGGTTLADVYGRGYRQDRHPHGTAASWPDCTKWSVFRNPASRAVSIFTYLFRHQRAADSPEEFQRWCRSGFPCSGTLGVPDRHLKITDPQVAWLDGTEPVRLICFERLQAETDQWISFLEGQPAWLPRRNSFRARSWASYYDEAAFEFVASSYADDFSLYAALRKSRARWYFPGKPSLVEIPHDPPNTQVI